MTDNPVQALAFRIAADLTQFAGAISGGISGGISGASAQGLARQLSGEIAQLSRRCDEAEARLDAARQLLAPYQGRGAPPYPPIGDAQRYDLLIQLRDALMDDGSVRSTKKTPETAPGGLPGPSAPVYETKSASAEVGGH